MNQGGFVDLNFNPLERFSARRRGRAAGVRATEQHRSGHGHDRVARRARVAALLACHRAAVGPALREPAAVVPAVARAVQHEAHVERVVRVLERPRARARLLAARSATRSTSSGRARRSTRATRSCTASATTSWTRCASSWFGQFRSGQPFTPTIAGDVNGDGYSNDRAFIFDPSALERRPRGRGGMQQLLTNGSSAARECLAKQLGQLAKRNSCQGPWTSNASLSISFNPAKIRMPQRASIQFQLSNPLGAADMLLHDDDNLKGWGQFAMPDPSLLYVRGFDAATQRYRYEVNQRFGATNPQFSAFRAPVTLTAHASLRRRPDARAADAHAAARPRPHAARARRCRSRCSARCTGRAAASRIRSPRSFVSRTASSSRRSRRTASPRSTAGTASDSTPSGRRSRSTSARCRIGTTKASAYDRYISRAPRDGRSAHEDRPRSEGVVDGRAATKAAAVRGELPRTAVSRFDSLWNGDVRRRNVPRDGLAGHDRWWTSVRRRRWWRASDDSAVDRSKTAAHRCAAVIRSSPQAATSNATSNELRHRAHDNLALSRERADRDGYRGSAERAANGKQGIGPASHSSTRPRDGNR